MQAVVTPREMAAVDAAAPESVEVLIGRAGAAAASAALRMLGGAYGRRVWVVAGPGNNGRDGLVAAARLRRRGVRVTVTGVGDPSPPGTFDLVIDAAFGTGFRRTYTAPDPGAVPVLALDIPSGVDGLTGVVAGRAMAAARTVTFAALKPGLLLGDGRRLAGSVEVADIGLDVGAPRWALVDDTDLAALPHRSSEAHKWVHAVWVVGGSPGMSGAPALAAAAAARAGAGYVRLSSPGASPSAVAPPEAVQVQLPLVGWERPLLDDVRRVGAVVLGPGLGRNPAVRDAVHRLVAHCPRPLVVDGDGLWALGDRPPAVPVGRPTVLTPHDGEFGQLTGHPPGADRVAAALQLASRSSTVVLLKGPTTVVAEPGGRVAFVTSGDERLATAGTGDVLSGVIGALLSRGLPAFEAAAVGAHLHGRAASRSPVSNLVASDLPLLVAAVLEHPETAGR